MSSAEERKSERRKSPRLPRRVSSNRRKRPKFVRQESWRYKRVRAAWRKPRGIDSRMRMQRSGTPRLVKMGYRGPKKYRGLHPSGYREVLVHNPEELESIDPEAQAARIAASVGKRKRMLISEAAEEKGIKLLNPPVHREALETVEEEAEAVEEGKEEK